MRARTAHRTKLHGRPCATIRSIDLSGPPIRPPISRMQFPVTHIIVAYILMHKKFSQGGSEKKPPLAILDEE